MFRAVHTNLADHTTAMARSAGFDASPFNHALLEVYDARYRKMGFHSDQALDLAPSTHIAIVSCYLAADGTPLPTVPDNERRQLVVKHKTTGERFTRWLDHGSALVFSTETNAQHLHKIVLPGGSPTSDIRWLGLTLRTASTFVEYRDGTPFLEDGRALTLATETERRTFFTLRGQENREVDFAYPPLSFTISEGDRIPPV